MFLLPHPHNFEKNEKSKNHNKSNFCWLMHHISIITVFKIYMYIIDTQYCQ